MQARATVAMLVGCLMFCTPVRAEESTKEAEPPFLVRLMVAPDPGFRGLDRVEVSIRGQAKQTWRCVLHDGRKRPITEHPCPHTTGWMTEPLGDYSVFVSLWRHGERRPVVVGQRLAVSGTELSIRTTLWFLSLDQVRSPFFGAVKNGTPAGLATFTIERILPVPPGLLLKRAWTPSRDGKLAYELDNRSQLSWFGTGNMDNFFGRVETFQGGVWTPYVRGGTCGNDSWGGELAQGEKTHSGEGTFVGDVRPFSPGRYRYILEVARERHEHGYPQTFSAVGAPLLYGWDVYEHSDGFSIDR